MRNRAINASPTSLELLVHVLETFRGDSLDADTRTLDVGPRTASKNALSSAASTVIRVKNTMSGNHRAKRSTNSNRPAPSAP